MQKKATKIILYIAFLLMLLMAGYVIFFSKHMISNKYYFLITALAFFLVCAVFIILLFKKKTQEKKNIKFMIIICVVLIIFQVLTLPIVNLFSQTLPAGPRGTIYQFPSNSNSIAQNEVGLMMRYYLDGKTLYANENYPKDTHNGFLFITDEYKFIKGDYPILTIEKAEDIYAKYNKTFHTINVQQNSKLDLPSFRICISIHTSLNKYILITDKESNWYFISQDIYEEAFSE